jgi:RNA polymerase sigma-70 factor (ECF subfamily)
MLRAAPHLELVDPDSPPRPATPPTIEDAFRAYAPYVARIGLRLLGRPDEVDDLVQDAFVEAHRGLRDVREPAALKGWLATIAVRLARRRLIRRNRLRFLGWGTAEEWAAAPASGATPEQGAMLAAVYRALDAMPADQRIAWVLRVVEGEQLEETARLCGCSLATVKRWIGTAHAAVRKAVEASDG